MRVDLETLAASENAIPQHPLVAMWARRKNLAGLGVVKAASELLDDEAAILEFCEVVYSAAKGRRRGK